MANQPKLAMAWRNVGNIGNGSEANGVSWQCNQLGSEINA